MRSSPFIHLFTYIFVYLSIFHSVPLIHGVSGSHIIHKPPAYTNYM